MIFLATAMAAVAWGTSDRTAINLIGAEELAKDAKQIRSAEKERESYAGMSVLENERGDYHGDGLTYWRLIRLPKSNPRLLLHR